MGGYLKKNSGFALLPALMLSLTLAMLALSLLHTGLLSRKSHNQIKQYLAVQRVLETRERSAVERLKAHKLDPYVAEGVAVTYEKIPLKFGTLWKINLKNQSIPALTLETTYYTEASDTLEEWVLTRWSWHLLGY